MTVKQFLVLLRETRGPWKVLHNGQIRRRYTCPICAVAKHSGVAWIDNYPLIGLSGVNASAIAMASDDDPSCSKTLRAQLLAATVDRSTT